MISKSFGFPSEVTLRPAVAGSTPESNKKTSIKHRTQPHSKFSRKPKGK